MNLNNQPTINELAELFAARKDSLDNHILWVCEEGEVRIDPLASGVPEEEFVHRHPNLRARLSMYRRGHGWVGKKAAADKQFMSDVLQTLHDAWNQAERQPDVRVAEGSY
ncbi:hypothetical protein AUC61_17175 [Pseudomonas sp. S25]|uniref:Uncharacterized protein n=1 Tax=Pseudomonas maioricensis TaxID=1766623 RepID=A0ABS9ZP01_9PSED|nr:hypothetical protein [Pseudomonas sp. S25]MCI8211262.1 hypothetical protein [Pseudomonas sp. S25]